MQSEPSAYRPCVGIMVLNRDGRVWIGRRPDAPAEPEGPSAWWQMPQGGIDASEDPAKAALRELEEETGIRSVEIIAESPGWYTYDLPVELRPEGLGRALSRPEAEVVRSRASWGATMRSHWCDRTPARVRSRGAGPTSTSW